MILVKVGFLVATTYAATQIGFHYCKSSSSSLIKPSDTTEESFKHCNDEERKEEKEVEEKGNEVEHLRCVVNEMEETQEMNERKLLVYYGLKRQEMEILEFNKVLKMKTIEIDKMSKKIILLKFDNIKLQNEVRECDLMKKQLEEARMKIKELQKWIQSDGNARGNQLKLIEEQVTSVQADTEHKSEAEIQKKLKAGEELEFKAMHLKRRQKELQLEIRVLAIKLAIAEARLTSISNVTESEFVEKLRMEVDASRTANVELLKQVEKLQDNKFSMVEELVYQHWVNACLRHEVQSYQTPSNNTSATSTRLRQFSSPTKEFYYTTNNDTSSGKAKIGQKTSLLHKFKRWRRSMDNYKSFGSSPRGATSSESSTSRSSISIGSLEGSVFRKARDRMAILTSEKKSVTCSPETISTPNRRRRVSFNDSLNTIAVLPESTSIDITDDMHVEYRDPGKTVLEMENPNKEKTSESKTANELITGSNINPSFKRPAEKSEKGETLIPQLRLISIEENMDESKATPKVVCEHETTDHIEESATRIPPSHDSNTHVVQTEVLNFEVVFMFFLVLVLLYFWLCSFMAF